MENDNNIQELRQQIRRRLRLSQITTMIMSIFILYFLWSLITDFHSRSLSQSIINILLFLCLAHNNWGRYKSQKSTREKLLSDDPSVLEEHLEQLDILYSVDIFFGILVGFFAVIIGIVYLAS